MKLSKFLSREDNDRVFLFQSIEKLSSEQISYIENRLENVFFQRWVSHTKKISPELVILYNHFIVITTCEANISGCSIDSLTNEIKIIQSELGINLLNRNKIPYCTFLKEDKIFLKTEDLKVCFLDYREFKNTFLNNYSDQKIFLFNTGIMYANDLWIIPLSSWLSKNIR